MRELYHVDFEKVVMFKWKEMPVPYKYTYLLGTLVLFIPWAILYRHRKDLRNEMLFMGLMIGVGSFATAYVWWTVDWWRPYTITETVVGIEDILIGFASGGIAAVIYEEIFGKHMYRKKKDHHELGAICIALLLAFTIGLLFWRFHLTSFTASTIGMIIVGIILISLRRDLIVASLMNGILMLVVVLPVYYIWMFVSPGYIEQIWLYNFLSGIKITGIPIEELVFWLLFGFIIAPFYEYWQGIRLKR
jgi:hypothetical protein